MQRLKLATKEDLPILVGFALDFQQESIYRDCGFDLEKVEKSFQAALANPDYLVLLAVEKDRPVGMLVATVTELMFSGTKISFEIAWWLDPLYRKGRHALEMIEAYEYWAKEIKKVDKIQMVCLEDELADRIESLYKRRGYQRMERAFIKHGRN